MASHLYIAPAGAGKTTFVLNRARDIAQAWGSARLVVAHGEQARAAYRRLAQQGAFGVRIHTMAGLARELLDRVGEPVVIITDPIQIRLLRVLVDEAGLSYYAPLARKPGFIRALRQLFAELVRAQVSPQRFALQVQNMGSPPRLSELALLYQGYRKALTQRGWVDPAGVTAAAHEALLRAPEVARDWDLLAVDGFVRFTPSELILLNVLKSRVGEFMITMTGDLISQWDARVLEPVKNAWELASTTLELDPELLPHVTSCRSPVFRIASNLLKPRYRQPDAAEAVQLIAAPDQAGEVRTALRWLKQRIVTEGLSTAEVALLARDIHPYREIIAQTAAEFGIPVHIVGGLPLRTNPAVDALMSLLNLLAPQPQTWDPTQDRRFPFRGVLAAWRSPYFDWHWPDPSQEGVKRTLVIGPEDADALAALGRWGQVVAGPAQWWDAFRRRAKKRRQADGVEEAEFDEEGPSVDAPEGEAARMLWRKWLCFRRSLRPPTGERPIQIFVRWLETLIGPETMERRQKEDVAAQASEPFTLNMVQQIRSAEDAALVDRDIAALAALKETLRGMVWAAESLKLKPVTFEQFLDDLGGALEAAHYEPRRHTGQRAIFVGDVESARGLRFQAVAILGLAEGSFPAVLHEDPFLRRSDREALNRAGLRVPPSPRNEEAALFYQALSRTDARLLILRPRLAEGGAEWQASPFWRWLEKSSGIQALELTHETMLSRFPVASYPELLYAYARSQSLLAADVASLAPAETLARWRHGARIVKQRQAGENSIFDGALDALAPFLSRRFGPGVVWSVSRLETYLQCPFRFLSTYLWQLEERQEPEMGMDAQQRGKFFHRALELIFRRGADQAADAEALIAIWEKMADELLDEAPERYGFRPTAWWPQTRERMKAIIRQTLTALAQEAQGWRPRAFEARFGFDRQTPPLNIPDGENSKPLQLRGVIDRVDSDGQGNMRIIDYKTGSTERITWTSLKDGQHLQLPIYGMAASEVLELGELVDGFYWSVTKAKASSLRLKKGGVDEAISLATGHVRTAVQGIRSGRFQPRPPAHGCPSFCPAAAFCWHFRAR